MFNFQSFPFLGIHVSTCHHVTISPSSAFPLHFEDLPPHIKPKINKTQMTTIVLHFTTLSLFHPLIISRSTKGRPLLRILHFPSSFNKHLLVHILIIPENHVDTSSSALQLKPACRQVVYLPTRYRDNATRLTKNLT